MSCEREGERQAFLAAAGLGAARRDSLAGDASTRRYERLYPADGGSLIFMDQPPAAESRPCPPGANAEERVRLGYNALARLAAGKVEAFVACAGYLGGLGLSAPRVIAADPPAGFAVLEDLGNDLYARLMESGADETPFYDAAIEVMALLHAEAPPAVLGQGECSWPLLTYDDLALKTGGDVFLEWLPAFAPGVEFGPAARAEWEDWWAPVRQRAEARAEVFCHRDFHAENLLWMAGRQGPARVGLLDFQDAVRAHPAWDMSMLLHDARRTVTAERERVALERYFALRPEVDRAAFTADYHALGALNVCRIIGIFSRLVVRDGKPRYAAFMPRLWTYLDRCLADPAAAPLARWMATHAAEAR